MLDVTVALLLFADDAATPVDSAQDMQLAASISEKFCNESHLFISVPKTFLTIFHPADDHGVTYDSTKCVRDEGPLVQIRIYDLVVAASSFSKYLGVHLKETLTPQNRFNSLLTAYKRAMYSLQIGLNRIPSYSHDLFLYL